MPGARHGRRHAQDHGEGPRAEAIGRRREEREGGGARTGSEQAANRLSVSLTQPAVWWDPSCSPPRLAAPPIVLAWPRLARRPAARRRPQQGLAARLFPSPSSCPITVRAAAYPPATSDNSDTRVLTHQRRLPNLQPCSTNLVRRQEARPEPPARGTNLGARAHSWAPLQRGDPSAPRPPVPLSARGRPPSRGRRSEGARHRTSGWPLAPPRPSHPRGTHQGTWRRVLGACVKAVGRFGHTARGRAGERRAACARRKRTRGLGQLGGARGEGGRASKARDEERRGWRWRPDAWVRRASSAQTARRCACPYRRCGTT